MQIISDLPAERRPAASSAAVDLHQLTKDMSRDRIIIQGVRLLGSHSSVDFMVDVCKKSIVQLLAQSGLLVLPPSATPSAPAGIELASLDSFCLNSIHSISRTESAFLSHAGLCSVILDMANKQGNPHWRPFLVVPESTLADALLVRFSIKSREPSPASPPAQGRGSLATPPPPSHLPSRGAVMDWCILCEGEASTVYRLLDPDSMDVLVQVRITVLSTFFAMPRRQSPSSTIAFSYKVGKSYLTVSKETTTTGRDFK